MANSYLGGHSLHRRSWFGRGKQIQESPLQDTEVYDDVELLSRLKAAHVYRRETPVRSPVQKISAQSDEVAIIEFLWEFAHVKADIAEAVTAEDVRFGARIARLKAVHKRADARMTPPLRNVVKKVENRLGRVRRSDVHRFVRLVLQQLKSTAV